MQQDALPQRRLEFIPDLALDEIPHQAANERFRVTLREIEVRQIVHVRLGKVSGTTCQSMRGKAHL
jgi:hypothetical protein